MVLGAEDHEGTGAKVAAENFTPIGADPNRPWPKVRLTVFAYGDMKTKTHECVLSEIVYAQSVGCPVAYNSLSGSALIDKNRSIALTSFMNDDKEDVMIMLDHDMVWQRGWLIEVARKAHELQSVVGGVYSKRKFAGGVTCCDGDNEKRVQVGTGQDVTEPCERLAGGFTAIPKFVPHRLIEHLGADGASFQRQFSWSAAAIADGVSTSCYCKLIELCQLSIAECRPAQDSAAAPIWDFFRNCRIRTASGEWTWLGEDFAFCARLKHCGIAALMHCGPAIGHIGDHTYTTQNSTREWPPK